MIATDTVLRVRGLRFSFGTRLVLNDVDLTVSRGEVVAVLGPSGSGKSTLLRLISGLERPESGQIELLGRPVADALTSQPPERREIGLVFQEDALFPHLSIMDNVAFGIRGVGRSERRERARAVLHRLGLADRSEDFPHRLSGGEQQRVAVARALAPDPALILMDEPFSRLDSALRRKVREDIVAVLRDAGVGVILVTHDAEEAMSSADRLVLMAKGRVLQTGAPSDCYRCPASLEAGRLLGPLNAMIVPVEPPNAISPFGPIKTERQAAGRAVIAFRPEALSFVADGVPAIILARAFCGADVRLKLALGGDTIEMIARVSDVPAGPIVSVGLTDGQVALLPIGDQLLSKV